MALPQDGQNANGLTKVTEVPTGKELIFVDPTTNEGGIITLEDLTTQILNKLTSKIFTLDQGNITLIEALNKLNSNKTSSTLLELSGNIDNFLNKTSLPMAYFVWGTIGGLFGGWAWGVLICAKGTANFIGIRNDNKTLAAAHYENGAWSKISTWS